MGTPDPSQVVLDSLPDAVTAHLLVLHLEQEGIRARVLGAGQATWDPLATPALGGVQVVVAHSDAPRAAELLRLWRSSAP